MKRLPKALVGQTAIREAFTGDYRQLIELIAGALRNAFKLAGDQDPWPCVEAVFTDSVVVTRDGKLLRYPYTVDGTTVTLGSPTEVVERYVPAAENSNAAVVEAIGDAATASRWKIRVIRAGRSLNDNYYPDSVLREAVPLFDGARVFVKSDEDHIAGKGKDVRNLIGRLSEAAFVPGAGADTGEVQATLTLIEPDGEVATKMREAHARGMSGLFGFSIDARARAARRKTADGTVREAKAITKVNSVDLIVEPGAGGEVLSMLEAARTSPGADNPPAEDPDMKLRERLVAMIEAKKPGLLKDVDVDALTDEQLEAKVTEALATPPAKDPAPAPQPGLTAAEVDARLRMVEARSTARTAIATSTLPAKAKGKLQGHFDGLQSFTEADVTKAIEDERTYVASFTESGRVRDLGVRIETGETRAEKVAAMLDAFFDRSHKDHKHARSFRECYVEITGDRRVTGRAENCDESRMAEALDSGSFANVLGNSITRRMLTDYRDMGQYDVWRQLVAAPVPINDFRSQERTRFGGYGDIPIVAEKAPYVEMTSPTDEKATYAVAKRGGTEDVTLEMIKNDDVGSIQRIPVKLSRAAKRTLAKFVLDFLRTNPVIYDSVNLFDAGHGNLGTAALDATSLAAARLAMLKQTERDSNDRLGIGPKGLFLPPDLVETATNLFNRNTNNDKTFVQAMTLAIVPVWYWTDVNDWVMYADPNDIPSLEIGFLDGEEEPQLFVQDMPNVGSMFTNDKLTWKLRHIYGGAVTDYRGLYKGMVP